MLTNCVRQRLPQTHSMWHSVLGSLNRKVDSKVEAGLQLRNFDWVFFCKRIRIKWFFFYFKFIRFMFKWIRLTWKAITLKCKPLRSISVVESTLIINRRASTCSKIKSFERVMANKFLHLRKMCILSQSRVSRCAECSDTKMRNKLYLYVPIAKQPNQTDIILTYS